MRVLFIIDPPVALKAYKDSSVALMRAVAARGDEVFCATTEAISLSAEGVAIDATAIEPSPRDDDWYRVLEQTRLTADNTDVILMRKEPPVDDDYIMATRLLDIIGRRTAVHNAPRALREWNEKTAIFNFPDFIPPTWVGASLADAMEFRAQYPMTVLKPLNGMGGQGICRLSADDKNFSSIFNLLSDGGRRLIMAQAWLEDGVEGDHRVFVINGKPYPLMLSRIPTDGDFRSNIAAGGTPVAGELSAAAKKVADAVAPVLLAHGVSFAGLDVIGDKLIEINITCPTGLREIADQTGSDIAGDIMQALCAPCSASH